MKKYNVVELFAGVGGLSYGFAHNDNFEILMANEYNKDIATAYLLNHPKVHMIQGDIREVSENQIKSIIGERQVDIVVGGPPCQSYSTLGKRRMDERAHLFEEYCRVLTIIKPKMFLFENVSGLLSMQGGKLIETIKDEFRKLGYILKSEVLNAVNYGVPQYRDRVILVGMRNENVFEFPRPTHSDDSKSGLKPFVTLKDAIGNLPFLSSGEGSRKYLSSPTNYFQKFVQDTMKLMKTMLQIMENT